MKSIRQPSQSVKKWAQIDITTEATVLAAPIGKGHDNPNIRTAPWTTFLHGVMMLVLVIAWSAPALALSEWEVLNTLNLKQVPADLQMSADRRHLYILTDRGQIMIYGANGQLKDSIDVGRKVDQIKPGPGEGTLFLLSRKNKTVRMIRISTIEEIDITNAPYKGNANAEVSVIVFSDFQ